MAYDFTLKFRLSPGKTDVDALIERLGAEGCDDATIGIGRPGRIALDFTREARSAKAAILGAIADVRRVVPGSSLQEVAPDFVGISDVARVVGVTRQAIRKVMLAHEESFPAPLHEGSASIWHLAHVLDWLRKRRSQTFDQATYDVAYVAMQVNLANENRWLRSDMHRELREAIH